MGDPEGDRRTEAQSGRTCATFFSFRAFFAPVSPRPPSPSPSALACVVPGADPSTGPDRDWASPCPSALAGGPLSVGEPAPGHCRLTCRPGPSPAAIRRARFASCGVAVALTRLPRRRKGADQHAPHALLAVFFGLLSPPSCVSGLLFRFVQRSPGKWKWERDQADCDLIANFRCRGCVLSGIGCYTVAVLCPGTHAATRLLPLPFMTKHQIHSQISRIERVDHEHRFVSVDMKPAKVFPAQRL
jgi:hypothetical protein